VVDWDRVGAYLALAKVGDKVAGLAEWAKEHWNKLGETLHKLID
jgi:hypothetical protein